MQLLWKIPINFRVHSRHDTKIFSEEKQPLEKFSWTSWMERVFYAPHNDNLFNIRVSNQMLKTDSR